jgi:hypothetical protein
MIGSRRMYGILGLHHENDRELAHDCECWFER